MSLANIRRLLQEDTVLRLPAIVAYAAARKQVVSLVALQTCSMEDGSAHVTQICMLHVNTQGKIQWTYDMVSPGVQLPAAWMRQNQLEEHQLAKAPTWRQGWATAIHHMAQNNTIVVSNSEDIAVLQQQFVQGGAPAPVFAHALSLRGMFQERHPSKSASMKDMAAYYQVYLDPDKNLKAGIVTCAKLLEKMLAETLSPEGIVEPPATKHHDLTTDAPPKTLDDARKWVVRAEAGARTPLDFFTKIAEQFAFRLVHHQRKIQGYAVQVNDEWIKGTQLESHLGWAQICQDHHWRMDDAQVQAIAAIQDKGGV